MFYLTTHSTHFIYGYMASHMVKDHSGRMHRVGFHTGAFKRDLFSLFSLLLTSI